MAPNSSRRRSPPLSLRPFTKLCMARFMSALKLKCAFKLKKLLKSHKVLRKLCHAMERSKSNSKEMREVKRLRKKLSQFSEILVKTDAEVRVVGDLKEIWCKDWEFFVFVGKPVLTAEKPGWLKTRIHYARDRRLKIRIRYAIGRGLKRI